MVGDKACIVITRDVGMCGTGRYFLPSFCPSLHRFLLTFSTSADQYIKRWQIGKDLFTQCFVSVVMFLIRGSFLHCRQRMCFSLKFSSSVKPIQCCSMEVAPCMIDLNVTPGHKSHLRFIVLDSIVRQRLHRFSFAILSDTCDN